MYQIPWKLQFPSGVYLLYFGQRAMSPSRRLIPFQLWKRYPPGHTHTPYKFQSLKSFYFVFEYSSENSKIQKQIILSTWLTFDWLRDWLREGRCWLINQFFSICWWWWHVKCCYLSNLSSLWGMKDRRKLGNKEIRKELFRIRAC